MPRLQRGQVASGVRAKQVRAQKSVEAIIAILNEALHSHGFTGEDARRFARLSDLAMMDDATRGISPMSVRTLRNNVDAMYPGGMRAFRAAVLSIGEKAELKAASSPVIAEVWLEDAVLDMTARYSDLLQRFKRVALQSDMAEDEIRRHFSRYRSRESLRVVK